MYKDINGKKEICLDLYLKQQFANEPRVTYKSMGCTKSLRVKCFVFIRCTSSTVLNKYYLGRDDFEFCATDKIDQSVSRL